MEKSLVAFGRKKKKNGVKVALHLCKKKNPKKNKTKKKKQKQKNLGIPFVLRHTAQKEREVDQLSGVHLPH